MKDSHYRISLDIHSTQSQVSLPVKQGDTSRKVFISLCEGGKPYQIEKDCYAVFSAKKPDGKIIENYCIIADNVIEYTFTEQTTAVSGMLDCEIKLYGGESGLITSPRFTVIVDSRAVIDAEIESYSEYTALTNLYTITNSAAANANGKAELANAAAENANSKAELANTAAEKAEDQTISEATVTSSGELLLIRKNGREINAGKVKGDPGEDVNYNLVSNALKGSASGNPVHLDDVSPVEHEMKVKVSDPSATVTRYGKNLFDKALVTNLAIGIPGTDLTETIMADASYRGYYIPCKEGEVYSISRTNTDCNRFRYAFTETVPLSNVPVFGASQAYGDYNSFLKYENVVVPAKAKYLFLYLSNHGDEIHGIQIERGSTATSYEEFKPMSTHTPLEDGTVDGVTSLYPTTILTTDTEGVTIDVEYNKDANKVIGEILDLISIGSSFVTDVNIYANKWVGTASPYSQVVTVAGATKRSQVDLTPSAEQLSIFHSKDLAFVTENDNGVITVYAIGQKPTNDYTIQATVTEVNV